MGYDCWANGEWVIPKENYKEARDSLLTELAAKYGFESVKEWLESEGGKQDPRRLGPKKLVTWLGKHIQDDMDIFFLSESGGALVINPPDGEFRNPDESFWLFDALAHFADPEKSQFDCSGEDGAQWRYIIRTDRGGWTEEYAEPVWGKDADSPGVLHKIIDLLYTDKKPASAQGLSKDEMCELLGRIEDAVREGGFGPQAGMNELERLAEV